MTSKSVQQLLGALAPGLMLVFLVALSDVGCSGHDDPGPGQQPPDAGQPLPDAGQDPPDSGQLPPDAGQDPPDAGPDPAQDLVQYVNPFIGTDDSDSPRPVPGGAGGSTYPGAVVPFGMVQLSPDTPSASPSGYRFSDTSIEQFSVTHFDGAGCPNNEDLPFLPIVGELTASPGTDTGWPVYRAGYDKASEKASPGYYRVTLEDGIDVELTATTRTGFARLRYPSSTSSRVLLHTGRSATGTQNGSVEIVGSNRLRGTATAGNFCGSRQTFLIHFAIEFDAPFTGSGTWLGDTISRGSPAAQGVGSGAFVTFDTTTNATVQMKIGVSFVSVANAEANLAAENAGWDFDAVHKAAADQWNQVLNRIEVTGGSADDLTKFYTALYHVFQSPNVANDVNGEYMGFNRAVHRTDGWTMYQNYSGWDIIRSWTHLVAAVAPEAPDIIRSMVQDGAEGGLLPFWTHQNVETRVMVGDPGTVNVANAYAMGVRGFDTAKALELMVKSGSNPNDTHRYGLADWINLHFAGNAAMTQEYAMADFALAQFADGLGETATRDEYLARSAQWRESWNQVDGYIEPRIGSAAPGGNAARIYEVEVFGPDAPTRNVALGGTATASASCNPNEGPNKAINGTWTGGNSDKWCDNTSAEKWLQLDLGSLQNIDHVVIHHSAAGGESPAWNTQDFAIRVSADGVTWTVAATVTGNTEGTTTHAISPASVRYVRLDITTAIQIGRTGDWDCQPFDVASDCGFIEGNASQYVWMVPHDLEGIFTLMGGHAAAVTRLDEHFTELNAGTTRAFFYIGNEPEHGTPWTYNFAQAPWKTQGLVRRIINEEFTNNAGGLPGNDDLGASSAWLVWAYLGMYPVIPGTDVLVINGPQFPSIVVHLANGNTLTIKGDGAGVDGAHYIQSLSVNGQSTSRSWLRFGDMAAGSTLQFTMGNTANQTWGSADADRPPSFGP